MPRITKKDIEERDARIAELEAAADQARQAQDQKDQDRVSILQDMLAQIALLQEDITAAQQSANSIIEAAEEARRAVEVAEDAAAAAEAVIADDEVRYQVAQDQIVFLHNVLATIATYEGGDIDTARSLADIGAREVIIPDADDEESYLLTDEGIEDFTEDDLDTMLFGPRLYVDPSDSCDDPYCACND